MIKVTRLNRVPFYLNALLIEQVDSTPDTVIRLVSGRKLIVLESADEVSQKITDYYRQIGLAQALAKGMKHLSEEADAE